MTETNEIRSEQRLQPTRHMTVGENLPKAMGPADMMRAFGIRKSAFFQLQSEGEFRPFLLPRPIAGKKYSGEKVQAFLNGRKDDDQKRK